MKTTASKKIDKINKLINELKKKLFIYLLNK